MKTTRVIPILRIFDVVKAKEFYVDFLGCAIDWEHRFEDNFPLYMQVSRDGLVLHLSEHHGDGSPGAAVYAEVKGLKAYHKDLLAKNYRYNRPGIEKTPWNSLCVDVTDPFGNRISFNEKTTP